MDIILGGIGLILAIVLGGVLLVGLGIGLVVLLMLAVILSAVAYVFFYFVGADGVLEMISPDLTASNIPDKFIACLQSEAKVDECRISFTSWPKKRNELLEKLAKDFKSDLGKRLSSNHWNSQMKQVNGKGRMELSRESVYERNEKVIENFILIKEDSNYKIENFSINYQKGSL